MAHKIFLALVIIAAILAAVTAVVLVTGVIRFVILPAARFVRACYRFTVAPWPAKRKYPRLIWHRVRWHWLTRNLGLTCTDPKSRTRYRAAIGPTIFKNVNIGRNRGKVYRLPVSMRADPFGIIADIRRTVPKVGRLELEDSAAYLADAWRCVRVQVSQRAPGQLTLRGLDSDPLAVRYAMAEAPAGIYADPHPFRPYLGRDEWGNDRYLDLSGLTGITIAGLPRYGKTLLMLSLLYQLAGTGAVQFVLIDGKGGGDYAAWNDRAWLHCDDDLGDAVTVLEDVHAFMRRRLSTVVAATGHRNAWHQGPTPEFPLIVTVIDECHTFYDLDGVKNDKQAETQVRACRSLSAQLVKKGGAVLFVTICLTQKQTSDAIPTSIRDNCGFGVSFAVRSKDAAVAGLGEGIREYPSYCPTTLRERPTYIGACTASLPTGADPFVRLRVPEISEAAADLRARQTACLRRDPTMPLVPELSAGELEDTRS